MISQSLVPPAAVLSANTVNFSTFSIAVVTHPQMMALINSARYTARNPRRNAAGLPLYRSSTSSTSVSTSARRHMRA